MWVVEALIGSRSIRTLGSSVETRSRCTTPIRPAWVNWFSELILMSDSPFVQKVST